MNIPFRYRARPYLFHCLGVAVLLVALAYVVAILFVRLPDRLEVDHLIVDSMFEIWLLGACLAVAGNMLERNP